MDIKKEVAAIKARNTRVELDKKWETSWTRRVTICVLTFLVVLAYNFAIGKSSNIFFNSAVPVIGFSLSTLSLNIVRSIWNKK